MSHTQSSDAPRPHNPVQAATIGLPSFQKGGPLSKGRPVVNAWSVIKDWCDRLPSFSLLGVCAVSVASCIDNVTISISSTALISIIYFLLWPSIRAITHHHSNSYHELCKLKLTASLCWGHGSQILAIVTLVSVVELQVQKRTLKLKLNGPKKNLQSLHSYTYSQGPFLCNMEDVFVPLIDLVNWVELMKQLLSLWLVWSVSTNQKLYGLPWLQHRPVYRLLHNQAVTSRFASPFTKYCCSALQLWNVAHKWTLN